MIRDNLSEESVTNYAENIRAFLDSQTLAEMIDKYRVFCNEHKETLNMLSNIIENTNHRSIHASIHAPRGIENKGFNPFEHLKFDLDFLYQLLITQIMD